MLTPTEFNHLVSLLPTGVSVVQDGEGILSFSGPPDQAEQARLIAAAFTPLAAAKSEALEHLNTWRGQQRAALGLTSVQFQELVYTGKVLECARWRAAPETTFGLAGEAAARGVSNEVMAEIVEQSHAQWQAASDAIEAAYFAAVPQIESAETEGEIATILAGLN